MFSKSCKYGIRAVLFLAVKSSEKRKFGVQEIADELDVPKHFLGKILQQLSKYKIISSSKGPGGGFYLNEENKEGNIIDVVDCIDGKEVMNSCILGLPACSSENPCPLHVQAYVYREGLNIKLKHQKIRDLAKNISEGNFNF